MFVFQWLVAHLLCVVLFFLVNSFFLMHLYRGGRNITTIYSEQRHPPSYGDETGNLDGGVQPKIASSEFLQWHYTFYLE